MNRGRELQQTARALHRQLALPVTRANVWGWSEGGTSMIVVEIAADAPSHYRSKVPSEFAGFPVVIRNPNKDKSDRKFKTTTSCLTLIQRVNDAHRGLFRRAPSDRPLPHDDEAGALQMLDETLRHDLGHDLVGVVDPFAAVKPEREARWRGLRQEMELHDLSLLSNVVGVGWYGNVDRFG